MICGRVLLHKNYEFPDGGIADKYLVILCAEKNGQTLVVKTTSKQRRRPLKDGCHPGTNESVYVFNANPGGFKTTTWLILEPIIIATADVAKRLADGICKKCHMLSDIDARSIINCLKRCEDVSPAHLEFFK